MCIGSKLFEGVSPRLAIDALAIALPSQPLLPSAVSLVAAACVYTGQQTYQRLIRLVGFYLAVVSRQLRRVATSSLQFQVPQLLGQERRPRSSHVHVHAVRYETPTVHAWFYSPANRHEVRYITQLVRRVPTIASVHAQLLTPIVYQLLVCRI